MRITVFLVVFGAALVTASQRNTPSPTTINQHKDIVSLLLSKDLASYVYHCAGVILNNRSVVTAARCVEDDLASERWRFRVGSNNWASGGVIYSVTDIIMYNDYDPIAVKGDVAIIRSVITFGENIEAGRFSGLNYVVPLNQNVVTAGWGFLSFPGFPAASYDQLYQLQQTVVDMKQCYDAYYPQGIYPGNDQLCSMSRSQEARDKCFGGAGGPLYHNGVVVGIRSYALGCLTPDSPTVSTRVSAYITWLSNNA